MTRDPTRPDATIPALDGFRALAIVIVMGSHVGLQQLLPGQFGVTLFFFLSGYLITTLLRREMETSGGISFAKFYLRRTVRILPPLYLTMLFLITLSALGLARTINAARLPIDLIWLSNYFPGSGIPINLWSLAVEEHYYFGFPLLFLLLARRLSFARCAAILMGLCGVVLAVRLWEVHRLADLTAVNFQTHTRVDSILFGSVLAMWNNPVADTGDVLPKSWRGYLLAAALLIPTFAIRDEAFRQTWRYTLQGLGLLVLFNTAIRDRTLTPVLLDNALARWIALLSYTLYLVHSGLIEVFAPGDGTHPFPNTVLALACSFAFAQAVHWAVEKPMARWRRRRERAMTPMSPAREPELVGS